MRRHSLDAVSLVFGVIFTGLGALYLTGIEVDELVFRFWPWALVVLGLAMLLTGRREDREALAAPVPPARPAATTTTAPASPLSPDPADRPASATPEPPAGTTS